MIDRSVPIHVVGQGLAGSVLSFLLLEQGYKVMIWDDGHASSSSMVAAGMWNPVSFRKLNRTWQADILIPAMKRIYSMLEQKLGCDFFHLTPLARIFPDHGSANEWDERSDHPEVKEFLSHNHAEKLNDFFNAPFGHGIIHHAGWLDVPSFLNTSKSYFLSEEILKLEVFAEDKVPSTDLVIYCTGWKGNSDPGFESLPIQKNKGEVLTVLADMDPGVMVNFGNFFIPLGENKFRLGATYKINPTDLDPTREAREELTGLLSAYSKKSFEVIDQQVGYRPTTPDRKRIIGFHPSYSNKVVFNGFGSRGVMLIPLMAEELVDHLANGTPLRKEVSVARYMAP